MSAPDFSRFGTLIDAAPAAPDFSRFGTPVDQPRNRSLGMAKPWADVAASPEFAALSPADKEAARGQYFDDVVASKVAEDERAAARTQFDQATRQPAKRSIAEAGAFESPKDASTGLVDDLATTASDIGKSATVAAKRIPGKLAEIADQTLSGRTNATGFGLAGAAVDAIGQAAGLDSAEAGRQHRATDAKLLTKEAEAGMSPAWQAAGRKDWFDEKTWSFGPAWSDWRSYAKGLVESLPEEALTMFPAMRLAKGAYVAELARTKSKEAAIKASANAATVAGGIGEGSLQGAQSAQEVREAITSMPEAKLRESDAVKTLMRQGLTFEQARDQLANDSASQAFMLAGITTGIFGGAGDRLLARSILGKEGGIAKRFLKGMIGEGLLEEFPQGYTSKVAENLAIRNADPDQPLTKGAMNEALGGLAIGAIQGGVQTAALGRSDPDAKTPSGEALPASDVLGTPGSTEAPAAPAPARTPETGGIESMLADPKALFAAVTARPAIFATIEDALQAMPEVKAAPPEKVESIATALKQMEADPKAIFAIATSQPELYQTIAKAAAQTEKLANVPDAAPVGTSGPQATDEALSVGTSGPQAADVSAETEAAYAAREAELKRQRLQEEAAARDQNMRDAYEQQLAIAEAADSGLRPEAQVPKTALQLELERLGLTPDKFPSADAQAEARATESEPTTLLGRHPADLSDPTLQFLAKKGSPEARAAAQDEIGRRQAERETGPTEADGPWMDKLFAKTPLNRGETRRAMELGFGHKKADGSWALTRKAREHRDAQRAREEANAAALDPNQALLRRTSDATDQGLVARLRERSGGAIRLALPSEVPVSADARAGVQIANTFGKRVVFVHSEQRFAGLALPEDPDTIYVNARSPHLAPIAIIGHELLHTLRRTNEAVYKPLLDRVLPLMKNVPEYRAWMKEALTAEGQEITDAELDDLTHEELLGDFMGDHFMDAKFWTEVFRGQERSWVEKMRDAISRALETLRIRLQLGGKPSFGSETYIRDVDGVRRAMAEAFNAWSREAQQKAGERRGVALPPQARERKQPSAGLIALQTRLRQGSRGVNVEVAPSPADTSLTDRFNKLTEAEKKDATYQAAHAVIPKVMADMGISDYGIEYTLGGYKGETNPSLILQFGPSVPYDTVIEAGKVVGWAFSQQAIIAYDESVKTGENITGFVKVTPSRALTYEEQSTLFKNINKLAPEAEGFTARDGSLVYGNFTDLTNAQFHDRIDGALAAIDVSYEAKSSLHTFRSDWVQPVTLEGTRYEGDAKRATTGRDGIRGQGRADSFQQEADAILRKFVGRDKLLQSREDRQRRGDARASEGDRTSGRGVGEGHSGGQNSRTPKGYATQVGPKTPDVALRPVKRDSISLVGIHYGNTAELNTLNGNRFGQGARSEEASRIPRSSPIAKRVYFYAQKADGVMPRAEGAVTGGFVYRAKLNNLYDFRTDPQNLIEQWRAAGKPNGYVGLEDLVLKNGYDGFVNHAAGAFVVLGQNAVPQPSEDQRRAGNYTKGHDRIGGLGISFENPAGSKRRPEWPTLKSHYGYILGTVGKDKDHIDVFVKPGTPRDWPGPVYVIDQKKASGHFDEHKVMLGWTSMPSAKAGYEENFTPGWDGVKDITLFRTMDAFKQWLAEGDTKQPAAPQILYARERSKPTTRKQSSKLDQISAMLAIAKKVKAPREQKRALLGGIRKLLTLAPWLQDTVLSVSSWTTLSDPTTYGTFDSTTRQIQISEDLLNPASLWLLDQLTQRPKDLVQKAKAALEQAHEDTLVETLAHELGHAHDYHGSVDVTMLRDDFRVAGPSMKLRAVGQVLVEAVELWESKNNPEELDEYLKYPFGYWPGGGKDRGFFRREWFAQLVAMHTINRELIREHLPHGYALIESLANGERWNAFGHGQNIPEDHFGSSVGGISQEVRRNTDVVHVAAGATNARSGRSASSSPGHQHTPEAGSAGIRERGRASVLEPLFSRERTSPGYKFEPRLELEKQSSGDWMSPDGRFEVLREADGFWAKVDGSEIGWGRTYAQARAWLLRQFQNDLKAGRIQNPSEARAVLNRYTPEQRSGVIDVWAKIASLPGAFRFAHTTATDPKTIAHDLGVNRTLMLLEDNDMGFGEGYLDMRFVDGSFAQVRYITSAKEAYVDASNMEQGGFGAQVYQLALTWAANNKYTLVPDPNGLSLVNTYRRTEQMLSAALRLGTTKYMRPHPDQGLFGWVNDAKTEAEEDSNLALMLVTSYENVMKADFDVRGKLIEKVSRLVYNFTSKKFENGRGEPVNGQKWRELAEAEASRAVGSGITTLQRAVLTKSILAESDKRGGKGLAALVQDVPARGILDDEHPLRAILYARQRDPRSGQMAGAAVPGKSGALRAAALGTARAAVKAGRVVAAPLDLANRGIEAAIRLPAKLLVAPVTSRLYDRVVGIGQSLAQKNPIAQEVAHGLVADYGLPEPYLDARQDRESRIQTTLRRSKHLIDQIAGLTRAEARVAYLWMQEAPSSATEAQLLAQLPEASRQTLAGMKAQIDALGQDAVSLGLLSQESYDRNHQAYLHRTYRKHELENPGAAAGGQKAKSIRADAYRGRGMKDDVAASRLPGVQRGDRYNRMELRDPGSAGQLGKLKRVVYLRAGLPIPGSYAGWRNDGVWEARWMPQKEGDPVGLWRDMSAEERERLGEIDEVRYAFARTMLATTRDIETARFLDWVRLTYAKESEEAVAEAGQRVSAAVDAAMTVKTYADDEWVQVPQSLVQGMKVKKYGALAGQYIPGHLWNDIRSTMNFKSDAAVWRLYDELLRAWKIAKTSLSPIVHTNNVMSNFILADMADVRLEDIRGALRTIIDAQRGDEAAIALMERFYSSGAEGGSQSAIELRTEVIEPMLKELARDQDETLATVSLLQAVSLAAHGNLRQAVAAVAAKTGTKALAWPFKAMIDAYRSEDSVFRLAKFLKETGEGKTDREAGKMARVAFLDYSINAPWIQALRRGPLPFIAFSYRAIPLLIQAAAKRPEKMLKYFAVGYALNALTYAILGSAGDEDKERRLMPDEKSGWALGIFYRMLRMPWNDEHGSPVFLDVRRWIPGGDIMDLTGSKAAIALPQWLSVGGPLSLFIELAANKSLFTGKPIVKESDTTGEQIVKLADHLFKFISPNLPIPNPVGYAMDAAAEERGLFQTYSWKSIQAALAGEVDSAGRPRDLGRAILSSAGVKLTAQSEDLAKKNLRLQRDSQLREINEAVAGLKRQAQKGGLTTEELRQRVDRQNEKKRDITGRFNERMGLQRIN